MLALVAAAALVLPASADLVLSVEDASGLRALLETAGAHAPSLAPQPVGATLRDRAGVDLLSEGPEWGLSPTGPRLLVFSRDAVGLVAPVRDRKKARRAMAAWIAQDRRRLGRIAGRSLFTASGPGARALLAGMSRPAPLPPALRVRAQGAVWLWARLADPLRAAVLSIDASGIGIVARGLVTASGPLLAGPAPFGCDGGIACVRAGAAAAGLRTIASALQWLGAAPQPELSGAARLEERLDAIDARQLSDEGSLSRALRITPVFGAGEAEAPPLVARVDLAQIDAAIAGMTPLDALRGALAAGAYAAHVVYGQLLRSAGPLTVTGYPARGDAAQIEIRLPLR